jgi:hypothetical protein
MIIGAIWALAWLICGLFCAAVASSKGRSAFAWLVIGLVFGVLGVAALLLMDEERPELAPRRSASEVRMREGWDLRARPKDWDVEPPRPRKEFTMRPDQHRHKE